MQRSRFVAVLVTVAVLAAGACTSPEPDAAEDGSAGDETATPVATAEAAVPTAPVTAVAGQSAAELALGASRTLHRRAPVVVLAAEGDPAAHGVAAAAALARRAPLLLVPDSPPAADVAAELDRLGAEAVLAVGTASLPVARSLADRITVSSFTLPPVAEGAAGGTARYDGLSEIVGAPLGPARPEDPQQLTAAVAALDAASPEILLVTAPTEPPGAPGAPSADPSAPGQSAPISSAAGAADGPPLPAVDAGERAEGTVVLAAADPAWVAAAATARAAGADVVVLARPDPRTSPEAIAAISTTDAPVVALGQAFGDAPLLTRRVEVAETGVELPGGGQVLFPDRRFIALYGSPGVPALGAMGEQDVAAAIARAQEQAAAYQAHSPEPVIPAFEIISTVASGVPGEDGDYSYPIDPALLRQWVDAAGEAGVYVVLDLQPGRTDFLTQARQLEDLLAEPHVGLALDSEWRLKPDEVHLRQIGSVTAAEVNSVAVWLAQLTADNDLPQKLLLLHQFKLSMITERETLDLSHDELAVLVHADGFGTPGQKLDTWRTLIRDAPPVWWGWKNFYDEDEPTMAPAETMAVEPVRGSCRTSRDPGHVRSHMNRWARTTRTSASHATTE